MMIYTLDTEITENRIISSYCKQLLCIQTPPRNQNVDVVQTRIINFIICSQYVKLASLISSPMARSTQTCDTECTKWKGCPWCVSDCDAESSGSNIILLWLQFWYTYPVTYNWSSGGPTGSDPNDIGQAMCSNESRTITSQAVTCAVPVHSDTRSQRTNRPRLPRFLRRNMVIVSNLCCWLFPPPPVPPPDIASLTLLRSSLNYCYDGIL